MRATDGAQVFKPNADTPVNQGGSGPFSATLWLTCAVLPHTGVFLLLHCSAGCHRLRAADVFMAIR
jgi:hypothetical protein